MPAAAEQRRQEAGQQAPATRDNRPAVGVTLKHNTLQGPAAGNTMQGRASVTSLTLHTIAAITMPAAPQNTNIPC